MSNTRSYLVCYDIADEKRLRKTAKILSGYGYRLQESVFFCKMTDISKTKLVQDILPVIHKEDDQVMIVDLGVDPNAIDSFITIGKKIPTIPKIVVI